MRNPSNLHSLADLAALDRVQVQLNRAVSACRAIVAIRAAVGFTSTDLAWFKRPIGSV